MRSRVFLLAINFQKDCFTVFLITYELSFSEAFSITYYFLEFMKYISITYPQIEHVTIDLDITYLLSKVKDQV